MVSNLKVNYKTQQNLIFFIFCTIFLSQPLMTMSDSVKGILRRFQTKRGDGLEILTNLTELERTANKLVLLKAQAKKIQSDPWATSGSKIAVDIDIQIELNKQRVALIMRDDIQRRNAQKNRCTIA